MRCLIEIALLHTGKGLKSIVLLEMRLPADVLLSEPVWDSLATAAKPRPDAVGDPFWRQHRVYLPRTDDRPKIRSSGCVWSNKWSCPNVFTDTSILLP